MFQNPKTRTLHVDCDPARRRWVKKGRQLTTVLALGLGLAACSPGEEAGSGPIVEGDAIGVEGAHEHGVVRLGLAVDGTDLTASFLATSDALFGFEHTPASEEEITHVREMLARVQAEAGGLIMLPAESNCSVESVEIVEAPDVHSEGDDTHDHAHDHDETAHEDSEDHDEGHDEGAHADHDDHDHDHPGEEDHSASGHSDVRFGVSWTCGESPEGRAASLQFGDLFTNIEFVDLTIITSVGQAAARVAPETSFRF